MYQVAQNNLLDNLLTYTIDVDTVIILPHQDTSFVGEGKRATILMIHISYFKYQIDLHLYSYH